MTAPVYNTATLANGLRVVHLPSTAEVIYCGFALAVGSRHETAGQEGLAHFCEHVTFKGTQKRSAMQILNHLERVGGDLNAFTNKEDTVFYAAVLRQHVQRAVELLSDLVFHSTYPQQEIDREVEVICDEIESYNDTPAELIFDEIENFCFQGHPLGHNILGSSERVRSFQTADAVAFTQRFYQPSNAVFFASGNLSFDRLLRLLERLTPAGMPVTASSPSPIIPSVATSTTPKTPIIMEKGTHQAHVMVGTVAFPYEHPLRLPLYLLNNLLGGPGMNARLNVALRERNGLVYTVESSLACYSDTGLWCTYFGCDPDDVDRCLRMVRHELHRLVQSPLSARQLFAAARQLKGQIGVAADNRESFALDMGRTFLHRDILKDISRLCADIDALTPDMVQQAAISVFDENKLQTLIFR